MMIQFEKYPELAGVPSAVRSRSRSPDARNETALIPLSAQSLHRDTPTIRDVVGIALAVLFACTSGVALAVSLFLLLFVSL